MNAIKKSEERAQAMLTRTAKTTSDDVTGSYAFIDSTELARRWCLPVSWIREQVRSRSTTDPLPHVKFGKYVRFIWGSPELEAWAARRIIGVNNERTSRTERAK